MRKGIGSVIAVLVVAGTVGYYRSSALGPRDAVQSGLDSAKKKANLKPEQSEFLRLQLSVTDFLARHGHPPTTLSEMVPEYFDEVPTDPISHQQYNYNRVGERFDLKLPGQAQRDLSGTPAKMASGSDKKSGTADISAKTMSDKDFEKALAAEEEFVYDSTGKRDPYRPFDTTPKFDPNDGRTPLERYDVGQLRLTATASDSQGQPTAMVEDEAGRGYPVRVGTKIGRNGGTVASIDADNLKILEHRVEAYTNKESDAITEMKIQKGVEGKKKKGPPKRRK